MTPFRSHVVFGLILLAVGIVFDFLFVQWKIGTELIKTNPDSLNSWAKQFYDLTKFYIIMLGFLNIALALLIPHSADSPKIDWIIFGLIFLGSILLIGAGLWYASAGPSFKWEARCTVLTIGLFAILLSLGFEIYKLLSSKTL